MLRRTREFEFEFFEGAGLDDNLEEAEVEVLRVEDEGISTTIENCSLWILVAGLIEDCRGCFLLEEED